MGFVKQLGTIMLNETHGKDVLVQVIRKFNEVTPFIVMNDYRIAYATNSLRRVDIMKDIIL